MERNTLLPPTLGSFGLTEPSRWEKLKYRIQHRINWWKFRYMVWSGYYLDNCEPIRCTECNWWKNFDDVTVDSVAYTVCESRRVCPHCGHYMGYWAYGHWEPPYL